MAQSMIKYKEHSFFIGDSYLEILLHFMIPFIESKIANEDKKSANHQWLSDFYESAIVCEQGFFPGGVAFDFDRILNVEEQNKIMLSLLKEVELQLIKKGPFICIEDLNKIGAVKHGIDNPYKENVKTQELLNILEEMQRMI